MRYLFIPVLGCLLAGCVIGDKDPDPNVLAARQVHADFIKGASGFDADPNRGLFYDSFEDGTLGKWMGTNPNSGDTWQVSSHQTNFGAKSLTFGNQAAITKALEFGEATLATKEAISLTKAVKPILIVFARFDRQGPTTDETAFKVEISPDLGFSWEAVTPKDASISVVTSPSDPERSWKRYRYDLSAYASQSIRLRFNLKATLSDRKLLYLDDVLLAETN